MLSKLRPLAIGLPIFLSLSYAEAQTEWQSVPSGTTNSLMSIWGASESSVFAVGAGGTILHYDGSAWTSFPADSSLHLTSVWGDAADDVFATGDGGKIQHFDGAVWTAMENVTAKERITLDAVWGSAGDDVFVACDHNGSGVILHYDGSVWTEMPVGEVGGLYGVWGSSGHDVFAVGLEGVILRYDGSTWSAMESGTEQHLLGVWGTTQNNVYAVGSGGTILHFDGDAWSKMESGTDGMLYRIWGSGGNDIFVVGPSGRILHFDGTVWNTETSGTENDLYCAWGSTGDDVLVVGRGGLILRRVDGGAVRNDGGTEDALATANGEDVAAQIIALETTALERSFSRDSGGFLDIIAEEYTYFDPALDERMDDFAAVQIYYDSINATIESDDPPAFELIDPRVQVFEDAAVLTFGYAGLDPEAPTTDSLVPDWHTTEVFQRVGGEWKLISTHWSYPAHRFQEHVASGNLDRDPVTFVDPPFDTPADDPILSIERDWLDRWGQGDPGGYLDLIAEEYTYFDMGLDERLDDREQALAVFKPLRGTIFVDRFEFLEPRIQRTADLAILTFNLKNYSVQEDGTEELTSFWHTTEVFHLDHGQWKLVSTHWSHTASWLRERAARDSS